MYSFLGITLFLAAFAILCVLTFIGGTLRGKFLQLTGNLEQAKFELWNARHCAQVDVQRHNAALRAAAATEAELRENLAAAEQALVAFKQSLLQSNDDWDKLDRMLTLELVRSQQYGKLTTVRVVSSPSGKVRIEWQVNPEISEVPQVRLGRPGKFAVQHAYAGTFADVLVPGQDYAYDLTVHVGAFNRDEIRFPVRVPTLEEWTWSMAGYLRQAKDPAPAIVEDRAAAQRKLLDRIVDEMVDRGTALKEAEAKLKAAGFSDEEIQMQLGRIEASLAGAARGTEGNAERSS